MFAYVRLIGEKMLSRSAGRRLDAAETVALPKSSEVFRVWEHPRSTGARQQIATK
jgi:hypothetical protein